MAAGDVDGGVDESTLEPEGAASSESPSGRSWAVLSSPLALSPERQELPGLPRWVSLPFPALRAGSTGLPDVAEDGSTIPTFTTCKAVGCGLAATC